MNPKSLKDLKTLEPVSCLPSQRKIPKEASLQSVFLPTYFTYSAPPYLEAYMEGQKQQTQVPSISDITNC